MNIAILIGISKYKSEIPLPACSSDVENMRALLSATQKYDDIHVISDQTNASQVKDALRAFFSKYQESDLIEEAFIYFSGHGVYQGDALLCCSDFDHMRPATTSISNSELDDLLRSVKPTVAVKVIDACQSGAPYIKDASAGFEKALGGSQLGSFICMASSRQDQSSFASPTESFFTAKWIDAALSKDNGSILYRDIQAALADAFVQSSEQTPFFVSQGTGLEVFSAVTEELKSLASVRHKAILQEKPDATIAALIEAEINSRDQRFVPHKKAMEAIEASKAALESLVISDPIVKRFYNVSVKTDGKLVSIPKSKAVAAFAEEQGWAKKYFTKVIQEPYKVKVRKDIIGSSLTHRLYGLNFRESLGDDDNYTIETRHRPASLDVTETLPLEVAELSLTSPHPSLPAFVVYIGIVHSLTEVMVLSSSVKLNQKGWTSRAPELSEVQWKYQAYPWNLIVKEPTTLWRHVQLSSEADIRKYLESLADKNEQSSDSPNAALES